MQSKPPRPAGVTVIASLAILVGLLGLSGSLAIFSIPALNTRIGATIGVVVLVSSLIWLLSGGATSRARAGHGFLE